MIAAEDNGLIFKSKPGVNGLSGFISQKRSWPVGFW